MRTRRKFSRTRSSALAGVVAAGLAFTSMGALHADGSEALGPPSIPIASGTGVVAAGVGLENQPGSIDITVPAGAAVNQVLLYWEGMNETASGDDDIVVDGNNVVGTLIGGPTFFFNNPAGPHYSSTYRADITDLGLVAAGPNSISVDGLEFDQRNDGAGILVIYDDGSTGEISIVDGNDLAFETFVPPLDTTAPRTFTFAPEPVDRTADIAMFFSSVAGDLFPGDRPSVIDITVDGVLTQLINVLNSNDGNEWDTVNTSVNVPAGATSITIQALSTDANNTENRPASFVWNTASVTVPVTPPPPGGGEGCTPGYWKQPHHLDSWVGVDPGDDYETVFGVDASFDKTLLGALKQGGGGEKALGRHAVAALLNSTNADVSYEYSAADVIALVQSAYASGDFNGVKNVLEHENEMGCPLN